MDDVLRNDSRAYHDFVGDLWKRGMLKFGGDRRSTVTPFFVAKKNGKLRIAGLTQLYRSGTLGRVSHLNQE